MRKTEYRGKRVGTGKWVYGNRVIMPCQKEDMAHILDPGDKWGYSVDSESVGHYAGKAKYNKKTYEGDIVEYGKEKGRYLVEWDEGECGFILRCTTEKSFILKGAMLRQTVVIGNRHDNPELLKETDNG